MAYIGVNPSNGVRRVHTYTVSGSSTNTFSGAGAEGTSLSYKDSNYVDVYQNGVKLADADYTATSGTSIVLGTNASDGDIVVIVVFDVFSVADTVSKADGGTFDNAITITTDDNTAQLELVSTDADSGIGPHQVFYRNSASPADADLLCELDFRGRNDNSQDVNYSTINVKANDVTDGEEDGEFILQVMTAGSVDTTMHIKPAEIVFNEDSIDRDFRVESNGNANMLVVDGGNDNVGIGGTGNPTLYVVNNSAGPGLTAANATAVFHGSVDTGKGGCIGFDFGASHTNYPVGIGYVITSQTASTKGDLCFYTRSGTGDDAPTERMRIVSDGRIGIGDSTPTAFVDAACDTQQSHVLQLRNTNATTGGGKYIQFAKANGDFTGSVTQSSDLNTVAFNTTSDYRLKENVSYDFDATSRLKQLKPARFNWISDENNTTIDGFIAHEVSGIVPEAISGEKDGTEDIGTIKDEDGNVLRTNVLEITKQDGETWTKTGTKNAYQGIDQSKLIPLLTKTLQEALIRIDTLEAEVKALKG